jgi:hypothetical protein
MTDTELDQVLNQWPTPEPSPALRTCVLLHVPRRERRSFGHPLRWILATAAASCVLAVGMEQAGHGVVADLSRQVQKVKRNVSMWVDDLWLSYTLASFRDSHLKTYVNGELRPDAVFGGSGAGWWLRVPEAGRYYLAMSSHFFKKREVPPPAGRFDGHVLDFQAEGTAIRIESDGTYGGGMELPVYFVGLRTDR